MSERGGNVSYVSMQSYNASIKIAGQQITIKRYKKPMLRGFQKKTTSGGKVSKYEMLEDGRVLDGYTGRIISKRAYKILMSIEDKKKAKQKEEERKLRFLKTNQRAKNTIHDIIACNVNKEMQMDPTGRRQKIKFMTLTFREEVMDVKEANRMFTDFMQRLSYYHYGIKKNVIKYLVVPELQERGVWHFHVVLFNCPYTSNKKRDDYPLEKIWGNGYVFINALKRRSGKMVDSVFVAQYVTKYLTKEIEFSVDKREMKLTKESKVKNIYDYEKHKELGLKNMKRYSASRGLKKPSKGYIRVGKEEMKEILLALKSQKLKKSKEFKKKYTKKYSLQGSAVESNMFLITFMVKQKNQEGLKQYILNLSTSSYHEKRAESIKINWKEVKEWNDETLTMMYSQMSAETGNMEAIAC